MSRVEFHYNVTDKVGYSCRLLRKVHAAGLKVLVLGPPDLLGALDAALWATGPSEFIPHCRSTAPPSTRAATPICLAESWPPDASPEVLLNLGPDVPSNHPPVSRHLEVVSTEPEDAQAGRLRWRHYQSLGMAVEGFDRLGQA